MVTCNVCGTSSTKWQIRTIVSDQLASQWGLSPLQRRQFDRRESSYCPHCGCSARSRSIAQAIISSFPFSGVSTFNSWVVQANLAKLNVAEINSCGHLHPQLLGLSKLSYSEYQPPNSSQIVHQDITHLSYKNNQFDLVLHSETLEHVIDVDQAISECRRILKPKGKCIFTIPIIMDRHTIQRTQLDPSSNQIINLLPSSYHGSGQMDDYLVCWEFGRDFIDSYHPEILFQDHHRAIYVFGLSKKAHPKTNKPIIINTMSPPKHPDLSLKLTEERMDPTYAKGRGYYYEHLARYLSVTSLVTTKTVLDCGCGVGYGAKLLVDLGKAKHVIGVDLSLDTIKYAAAKFGSDQISFFQNDVRSLSTIKDKSVDVVVSFEVIEHVKEQGLFLQQVKRVLKPVGIFVVSTPNKNTYKTGNEFHLKELYPHEFETLLKKYFRHLSIYHQSFELAQLVRRENGDVVTIDDEVMVAEKRLVYSHPLDPDKSQYLIAVCTSGAKLPELNPLGLTLPKADSFDLSRGLWSLQGQFDTLETQIVQLRSSAADTISRQELDDWISKCEVLTQELVTKTEYLQQLTQLIVGDSGKDPIHEITNLNQQEDQLNQQIEAHEHQVHDLRQSVERIINSKFYFVWQTYCSLRKLITGS